MKLRIFFIISLFLGCSFAGIAQDNVSSLQQTIQWLGIQQWSAGKQTKNVIAFKAAVYPAGNDLPYFNQRIPADPAFNYEVSVENPEFIEISSAEESLLKSNAIGESPTVTTRILNSRGDNILDISLLPFINKAGSVLKLKTFNLKISKTPKPSKARAAGIHTYAQNSVLANGKFVKIKISESGVYKLTYDDINAMGVNPANVRIFGYGGNILNQSFLLDKIDDLPEVAIYMNKGSDGVFNSGDYILFYANGVNKWQYDSSKGLFTHTVNCYSNYGYYFVTSDAGTGRKIETQQLTTPANVKIINVEEFSDYKVYDEDGINLSFGGREFYNKKEFNSGNSLAVNFDFPNTVTTTSFLARLDVAATATNQTTFSLSLNGGQAKSVNVSKLSDTEEYEKATASNATFTFTANSDTYNFSLSYQNATSLPAKGYLNYLEVNARRYLKMSGSAMQFRNIDNLNTTNYNQYKLSNAGANVQIWDITDPQNIFAIATTTVDGKMSFTDAGGSVKQYLAIDPTASGAFSKPEIVGVVPNQNLHALAPVDFIILTHPNFVKQAEKLAQAHRDIDNMTVAVVTTDQVYNEFSSGTPDATAYRWVVKMLYDRAKNSGNTADMPKYLLLFGRGTFDNRKIMSSSGDNLVLTYQAEESLNETKAYVTDDYFTFIDDTEGDAPIYNLMDLGVGRFPTQTVEQAGYVVDKTISYMKNQNKGIWKNQLCYIADDGDNALHMADADKIATMVSTKYPAFQINKIYLDSYIKQSTASGDRYPEARSQLLNLLSKGLFLLDYTGHAGTTGWAEEQVLTSGDVTSLTNRQLPLWIGATCNFLQFDRQYISAGEQVFLNPNGGGIGILSAARPVYAHQNYPMNLYVCENLFKKVNGEHMRLGDIVRIAKNTIPAEINKLTYVFIGDPALKLTYPTYNGVTTTQINDNNQDNDTLKALSTATLKGFVVDSNGNKDTDYNGYVYASVYDKMQRVTTLNNRGTGGTLVYDNQPNVLFSGKALVTKGEFALTFMLPKDIKYNFGNGRINYYVYDNVSGSEGQGYYNDFIVGGTSSKVLNDTIGPEISIYLNTPEFESGDKVNENPLFIAKIKDENGINRVGSGIGHDLALTIDKKANETYVVNDYFDSEPGSYTEGTVSYKLSDLAEGNHSLTFKAWDLLNNSNSAAIDFVVIKGLTPVIFSLSNYPNPVKTGYTTIVVKHDRPETVLNTRVDVYDLSGKLIWTFKQSNADDIIWDLKGSDGARIKTGIYLYKVSISTKNSEEYSKTNKMLVVE